MAMLQSRQKLNKLKKCRISLRHTAASDLTQRSTTTMMLGSIVCLLLLFSLNSISASQPEPSETFTHNAQLEPNGKIHLYWKFNQIHITFEVHGNTNGWVGIGISPGGSMMGADINVGWVNNGTATITDRHGVTAGNTYPPLDTVQNVELLGGSECDGWTVLKFRRQLAACDDQDMEITTDTMKVIYAWGSEDSGDDLNEFDYHTPERRGSKSLLLLDQPNFEQSRFPEGERHFQFDLLNDKFNVPDLDTYYNCRLFKLPRLTTKHHVVKIEPIIQEGNELNVHHMLVFECTDKDLDETAVGTNTQCYGSNMPPDFYSCSSTIHSWSIGGGAFYYPTHAGLPLGTADSPHYLVVETHYDNPLKKSDIVDSSGLRFVYTPDVRTYDAGIIEIGVSISGTEHIIPPNAEAFYSYGDCTAECLNYSFGQDGYQSINVFAALLHSHLLGRQITLQHIRNGVELPTIAGDKAYDFNYQETRYLPEERTVMLDDTLRVVCNYQSKGKSETTMGGFSTNDEMCNAFVYHYPRLALSYCVEAPKLNDLMSYFGFESYKEIGNENGAYQNLGDIMILKPDQYADKTALENINALTWDEAEVKQFETDMTTMLADVKCYGSTYGKAFANYTPVEITLPYVEEQRNCTAPSSGFPLTGVIDQCPTGQPVTTTSGASAPSITSWRFGALIVLVQSLLVRYK
uniref:DBH-like monooxygenase protein 1 homolog n=1 Tax=Phallusia mammillata TaxID=59560 RepID=A0A6F9DLL8_9ASCI|nr:DBH-like monooxygenase protein 1 homolog [Phallusia mammillata]